MNRELKNILDSQSCSQCFEPGKCTIGITSSERKLPLCRQCYYFFEQLHVVCQNSLRSAELSARKKMKAQAVKAYKDAKIAYLNRLEKNVAQMIKSQRKNLEHDAAVLDQDYDDMWTLLDAEKKFEATKAKVAKRK